MRTEDYSQMSVLNNIFEYDFVIYPRKLHVLIEPTLEQINDKFLGMNDKPLQKEQYDKYANSCNAITCTAKEKEDKFKTVLVIILDKENCKFGTYAHESIHVADIICEQLEITTQGFSDGGNEHYAYLVGFISQKIQDSLDEYNKNVNVNVK